MYNDYFIAQFKLLLKILPLMRGQSHFVIKGGTAINLFYRHLPRISVDIDLTYDVIESRDETLRNMNNWLNNLSNLIEKRLRHTKVYKKYSKTESYIIKLLVNDSQAMIKIEPNYVFRGTLFRTQQLPVSSRVTQEFAEYIDDIPVASFKDIFAGKICAALNRQHPRDLFDLKHLLENEGITHDLRQAFVVYLACDSRPMNELLNPNRLDIAPAYRKEFYAMTKDSITLDELKAVRETLIQEILDNLTPNEKQFLISVKQGKPDHTLLPFKNLAHLPALHWKVININKMTQSKHQKMVDKLKYVLGI